MNCGSPQKGETYIMKKQIQLFAVMSAAAFMTVIPAISGHVQTAYAANNGWTEENGITVFYDEDGDLVTDSWKKVGERLTKLGVENYVPTQTEIRQWSDRKKKVERVVIPMVVFVHTDEKTERSLRMHSFIRKILTYPGQTAAAVIPDNQIDRLKFMLRQSDSPVEMMEQHLQVGDKVHIVRGALQGLEGELYKNVDKSMVAIHIEALGYACVSVSVEDIEKIER